MAERMSLFVCQLALARVHIVCFQILPFLFDHECGLVGRKKRSCAIIVSPLNALMVDQVRNLRKGGVQAVIISYSLRKRSIVGSNSLLLRVAL